MTETVETREIGYYFSVTLEYELHEPKEGQRYDDKRTIKGTVAGHVNTYDEAIKELRAARAELDTKLRQY